MFGEAIEAMKRGCRVTRAGWNGRGMWLALTPGSSVSSQGSYIRGAALHRSAELVAEHGDLRPRPIDIAAHIDMRAADGTMVIGWLASQTDMLGDDWVVLDEPPAWESWLADALPQKSQQPLEVSILVVPDGEASAEARRRLAAAVANRRGDLAGLNVGMHGVIFRGRRVVVAHRSGKASQVLGLRVAHVWSVGTPGPLDEEARRRIVP